MGFSSSAWAASATWNGTTDAVWATLTNWSANPVPGTGDTATFNNAGGALDTINLGAGVTIRNILFDTAGAAAYTIGSGAVGSETLSVDSAGTITVNSTVANDQFFNAAIVLGSGTANQTITFTNNSTTNGLTFAGNITRGGTGGTKTLVVAGAGNSLISGVLSSVVAIAKTSDGTLTLTGANTNTGATTVSGGTLKLDFSAVGAPTIDILNNAANSSALTLNAGGTLDVTLSNSATANTQRFNGTTFSTGASSLRVTLNGNTNGASGLTLGSLTRNNNSTVDFTLPTTGAITTTSTTAFTGTNRVLTATSRAYATNDGTDWVTNTLGGILATTAGLYSVNTFTASSDVDITSNQAPTAFTVNTLRFNTAGTTLTLNSSGTSAVTAGGILITSAGTSSVIASGGVGAGLTSGATADQIIVHNYGGLTISAPIVDNGEAVSLVHTGTGTTVLSGANTHTGTTQILGGVVQLDTATTVQSSTVQLDASNALSFGTGVGTFTVGGLSGTGGFALADTGASAVTLQIGNNNAATTHSGVISGAGGIEKIGTGIATLSGVNTFLGDVTIRSGELRFGNTAGQGTSTALGADGNTIYLGDTTGSANATLANGRLGNNDSTTLENDIVTQANGSGNVLTVSNQAIASNGNLFLNGNITLNHDLVVDTLNKTTLGGAITGNGPGYNLSITGNGATTISGGMGAGVNEVIKSGTGALILSAANPAFVGNLKIDHGTLTLNAANTLGAGATVTLGNSSVGEDATISLASAANGVASNISVAAGAGTRSITWTIGNVAVVPISGAISLANSLILSQTGSPGAGVDKKSIYSGDITGTGNLILRDGTNPGVETRTGAVTLSGTSINNIGTITNEQVTLGKGKSEISGNLGANVTSIIQDSVGEGSNPNLGFLTLSGNNAAFTGGVEVKRGTLNVTSAAGLNSSNTVSVNNAAFFRLNESLSIAGLNDGTGGGGSVGNSTASARTLTIGGSGSYNFSGVIEDVTGALALTKSGNGTQRLSGASTYTGGTDITAGTLLINNTTGSGTGTGAVSVQIGGTLGGTGTISGAVSVLSGGALSPGNSPGNLTLNSDLTLAGAYNWELAALSTSNPGVDFDTITITAGNANITGASMAMTLGGFAPTNVAFWQTNQTWTGILNNTGGGSLTGSFAAIDNSTWSALGAFTTQNVDNDVNLVWTAVPEPSTWALLAFSLTTVMVLRRRRKA